MIYLTLAACVLIFFLSKARTGVLLDPYTFLFVGLLYYGFLIPILMTLFDDYFLPFADGQDLVVTQSDIATISYVLAAGYLAFAVGYRLITPRRFVDGIIERANLAEEEKHDRGGLVLVLTLAALMIGCAVLFYPQLAMVVTSYDAKIQARYESSAFVLTYSITVTTLAVFLVWWIITSKHYMLPALTGVLLLFGIAFLTFSKEPMVFAAFLMFAVGARLFPKSQVSLLVGGSAVGIAILLFVIPAFSYYRATGEVSFTNVSDVPLVMLFSDALGPFATLIVAIRGEDVIEVGSLPESLVLWVPRALWPDRPLDAAEQFARAIMINWQPGFGLGFSPFTEGVMRFGIFFSPVLLFLSGLVISGLQRFAIALTPSSVAPAVLFVTSGYVMFTFHRGVFSGIFTAVMQFWIPFLIVTIIIGWILRLFSNAAETRGSTRKGA